MIRYLRELRLIPIALIASACLLTLKVADLVLDGSHFLGGGKVAAGDGDVSVIRSMPDATQPPGAALSWAQQMFNFPNSSGAPSVPPRTPLPRLAEADNPDITGSVATPPSADKSGAAKSSSDAKNPPDINAAPETKAPASAATVPAPAQIGKDGKPILAPNGTIVPLDGTSLPSGAERAILERLQARRQELDTRARELDIRESLIQSAEKRVEARLAELKDIEARIKVETKEKEDGEVARMKGLITMYENMKPRDAAKIFNGLDSAVLLQVASQINPRTMSEILAQMNPDVAQRLTVEMASKAEQVKPSGGLADLPKIQGQPTRR